MGSLSRTACFPECSGHGEARPLTDALVLWAARGSLAPSFGLSPSSGSSLTSQSEHWYHFSQGGAPGSPSISVTGLLPQLGPRTGWGAPAPAPGDGAEQAQVPPGAQGLGTSQSPFHSVRAPCPVLDGGHAPGRSHPSLSPGLPI